jgi:AraC-like DNA-binding protein
MVSNRCNLAVKAILKDLGLHFIVVELGEVEIMESLTAEQTDKIRKGLLNSGLELMDNKKAMLIEQIKKDIIEMVHASDGENKFNLSIKLSEKLNQSYANLSNLFSEVLGTTIEQFAIAHKIERIKELIIYGNLSLTEIAWKMNYSSNAHLSNQFKKVTGLTPSHFKKVKNKKLIPIELVGLSSNNLLNEN